MKHKLSLLVILLITNICKAQLDSPSIDTLYKKVAAVQVLLTNAETSFNQQFVSDTLGAINAPVFNKYLDTKFTYLSYQRGALPTGNSASLDLLDNSTQLKLSVAQKFTKRPKSDDARPVAILTFGAQAKLDDGIATLFNGNVPSSGTTMFLNASFLGRPFRYTTKTVTDRILNGKRLTTPFGEALPKLKDYRRQFASKVAGFTPTYCKLLCRLDEINKILSSSTCDKNDCKNRTDLILERNAIESQLRAADLIDKGAEDIADAMSEANQDGYYALITDKPAWEIFKINWFDLGITLNEQTYTIYDGNKTSLSDRIGSKSYDSWGFKMGYNWFREKSHAEGWLRTWYTNLTYESKITDNYSSIDDATVSYQVRSAISGDTTYVFQTNTTAKEVTDLEFKKAVQHNVSGTFTAMFFEKHRVGINLNFQGQFTKLSRPIWNSRVGLLVAFANNNFDSSDEDSKSKINVELFMQFQDLNDVVGTHKNIWEKRVVGISTNIPFNKIFLN